MNDTSPASSRTIDIKVLQCFSSIDATYAAGQAIIGKIPSALQSEPRTLDLEGKARSGLL